ncbi:MAG TPA: hypothetical protein PK142_03470 [bacterium]|nr:hypothetical protein [bacterium]
MKKTVLFVVAIFLAFFLSGQNEFVIKIDKTKTYETLASEITEFSLVDFISYERSNARGGECISISLGNPQEIKMKSFSFSSEIHSEEILEEMEAVNCRPATFPELLALVKAHPELCVEGEYLVAIDPVWSKDVSGWGVPCVARQGESVWLFLMAYSENFGGEQYKIFGVVEYF